MAQSVPFEKHFLNEFWIEELKTLTYFLNISLTGTIMNMTAYEAYFHRKSNVRQLKIYITLIMV